MPQGAYRQRGEQMAALTALMQTHLRDQAPRVNALNTSSLDAVDRANIREMQRLCHQATAVDPGLDQARETAINRCLQHWYQAREAGDFNIVTQSLQQVIDLTQTYAQCLAQSPKDSSSCYEALAQSFQPGFSLTQTQTLFSHLQTPLTIYRQQHLNKSPKKSLLSPKISADHSMPLMQTIAGHMGYDFNRGLIAQSAHPFCSGMHHEVRITIKRQSTDLLSNIMALIHETGHALYEQGLSDTWLDQPVGQTAGMAVHESQSLFWEHQLARHPSSLEFLSRTIHQNVSTHYPNFTVSAAMLNQHLDTVTDTPIRVEADRRSYLLHIIHRFHVEQAMLEPGFKAQDLPDLWQHYSQVLLDHVSNDPRQGCLQDVHWYAGLFGYFPCYGLGDILAAQLYHHCLQAIGPQEEAFSKGDFSAPRRWLNSHIHQKASQLSFQDLIVSACGEPLDSRYYLNTLTTPFEFT